MADRPLIFSAPMIMALLAGRKSQTRRLLNPQPLPDREPTHFVPVGRCRKTGRRAWEAHDQRGLMAGVFPGAPGLTKTHAHTPAPGDRLWVREAWRTVATFEDSSPTGIAKACGEGGYRRPWAPTQFEADGTKRNWSDFVDEAAGRRRASMHLPRWASRLTLLVTDVRVERLQEISEEDAWAEGVWNCGEEDGGRCLGPAEGRELYESLWKHLHGADSWAANPWVWAATFETHLCNIDAAPAAVRPREAAYA